MLNCPSCKAPLKRGQSHCSQCGNIAPKTSKRKWGYYLLIPLLIVIVSTSVWLYTKWNEPIKEAQSEPDKQESFTASTAEEPTEKPVDAQNETLPETDIVTGTFYDPITEDEIDQFMYSFISAFTSATYNQDTADVEAYLASGSEFKAQTLDYLENTLFAKGINEDQLETRVVSITVNGENQSNLEDGETARVTTNETYRIIREDSTVIASFETTYAVIYQDGILQISKNLGSKELSREEETY
ncbi:hypothetical protein [Exiguobacterium sp. s151]|uniref:zinc ribbon domain-containing protein n=1 Tax=Exiguobacterium sp. s151 TaxID=2751229 RepID=UPI001BE99E68|nr:hypothetical protein [Exiguobacterium sp. s151]